MSAPSSTAYPFPERDLDRLTERVTRLLEEVNRLNTRLAWQDNILSNLYDNPFPTATAAEWDAAYEERDRIAHLLDNVRGIAPRTRVREVTFIVDDDDRFVFSHGFDARPGTVGKLTWTE